MNNKTLGIGSLIIIVVLGGWFMFSGTPAKAPAPESSVTNQMPVIGSTTPEMIVENATPSVTIVYSDQGFSPSSITVKQGQIVTWVNQSSENMWIASDVHPVHTLYDGTSLNQHCVNGAPTSSTVFDECVAGASGASYSFTFIKVGSWKYHNHVDSSMKGTIIVQ